MEQPTLCQTLDMIEGWTYEDLCFYTAFALVEGKKRTDTFVTDMSLVFAMLVQIHMATEEVDQCVH